MDAAASPLRMTRVLRVELDLLFANLRTGQMRPNGRSQRSRGLRISAHMSEYFHPRLGRVIPIASGKVRLLSTSGGQADTRRSIPAKHL
jgi:hypothetical protein